jgi:hypothetical protein
MTEEELQAYLRQHLLGEPSAQGAPQVALAPTAQPSRAPASVAETYQREKAKAPAAEVKVGEDFKKEQRTYGPSVRGDEEVQGMGIGWQSLRELAKAQQAQEAGIEAQMDSLEKLRRLPAQPDLSGAFTAYNAVFGQKLPYEPPKMSNAREYGIDLAKLENQIQAQRSKLSATDQALLRTLTLPPQLLAVDRTGNLITTQTPRPKAGGNWKPYDPNRDVQKLSEKLGPLGELWSSYEYLDKLVGGVDNWKPGKNIPGVGGLNNTFLGNLNPDPKSREIRGAYSDLKNKLLYAQSGKQINEQEFRRLSAALGDMGAFTKDSDLVKAMQRFRVELKEVAQQREAGFGTHPEVKQILRQSGGFGSHQVPDKAVAPAKNPAGKKDRSKMTLQELEAELKAKTGQ